MPEIFKDTAQIDAITNELLSLKQALGKSFQRRMVVLSGTEAWCFITMATLVGRLDLSPGLLVSEQAALPNLDACAAIKLKHRLGQEYAHIIWNGFASLNPDALGIASGLLKGGGIFFLLLPDFSQLIDKGDPDYWRMCADEAMFEHCHTFFLQRLIRHLQADPSIIHFDEQSIVDSRPTHIELPSALPPSLPTADQQQALAAIRKVATGHRYRPLVLQADRGRGKSSTLGIAAAQLYLELHGLEQHCAIAITAPTKQTCQPAFRHFQQVIDSHVSCAESKAAALSAFQFLPMDQLDEHAKQFHLIMVDEAAAISTALLQSLLTCHPRIVFATTLHGYEGHGQGFAIRFKQILDSQAPQWQSLSLKTPIRWLEQDPLEHWFFRFLLLNAELDISRSINLAGIGQQSTAVHTEQLQIHWLSQQALAEQESLFEALFALLVSAHYQTKPSDIRLILDHPHIHTAIAVSAADTLSPTLLGVLLILEEGGLDSGQAEAIVAGKRRPRGHLFPQALCASTGDPAFLTQRSYRITRIAVQADCRQRGVGSALLEAARERAAEQRIDSLSTSFGLRPELLSFWHNNQFQVVKLGLQADGASGNQSIMLMQGISAQARQLQARTTQSFTEHFLFNLPRQYQQLAAKDCIALLKRLDPIGDETEICTRGTDPAALRLTDRLRAYAFSQRPFELSNLDLYHFVLAQISGENWAKLGDIEQSLLVMKVLQAHVSLTCQKQLNLIGKKAIDQRLRAALQILLAE